MRICDAKDCKTGRWTMFCWAEMGLPKCLKINSTRKCNIMMQRTANENAACLRRICKRSDQLKIERIANNDARLILRKKLNGTTT